MNDKKEHITQLFVFGVHRTLDCTRKELDMFLEADCDNSFEFEEYISMILSYLETKK